MVVIGSLLAWYVFVGRHAGDDDATATSESSGVALATIEGGRSAEEDVRTSPVARSDTGEVPSIRFKDIAGLDSTIAELRESADYLANPTRFRAVGATLPRGVLLYGPPGNGKTLLAQALAGEAAVAFHSVSAASFVEQYVGVGAARIRSLFDKARANAPAIVFIDELDAVGRHRTDAGGGEREYDNTLNQLLVELDGAAGDDGVLIVAATNRMELLDGALVRPGRFDRRIEVGLPDLAGREAILRLHARSRPMAVDVDWRQVARDTAGLSAAELAGIVNEAALLAARDFGRQVDGRHVTEAVDRVHHGPRAGRPMSRDDKLRVAVHEAGHAVLAVLLRDVDGPPRVSIVSRAAGMHSPWWAGASREVLGRHELMAQLILLLGGRAADQVVYGEPTTRAEDDLRDAADLARHMVARWAMTGQYDLVGHDADRVAGPSVRDMVARAENAARRILADHDGQLRRVTGELARRETLTMAEVHHLVDGTMPALAEPRSRTTPA